MNGMDCNCRIHQPNRNRLEWLYQFLRLGDMHAAYEVQAALLNQESDHSHAQQYKELAQEAWDNAHLERPPLLSQSKEEYLLKIVSWSRDAVGQCGTTRDPVHLARVTFRKEHVKIWQEIEEDIARWNSTEPRDPGLYIALCDVG